jgi:hypothetical protein
MKKCNDFDCDFIKNDHTCGDYDNERGCQSPNSRKEIDWNFASGMTLRDWFAGKALQGLINVYINKGDGQPEDEELAHWAYSYGDAMLAVREKDVK